MTEIMEYFEAVQNNVAKEALIEKLSKVSTANIHFVRILDNTKN